MFQGYQNKGANTFLLSISADTPPLLFEVSSLENAFQIGGHPWHYIITPNKKKQKGVFHICALKDNSLVNQGGQTSVVNLYQKFFILYFSNRSTILRITFLFVLIICKQRKVQESTKNIANTCMCYPEFETLTFENSQDTKDLLGFFVLTVSLIPFKRLWSCIVGIVDGMYSGCLWNYWWNV